MKIFNHSKNNLIAENAQKPKGIVHHSIGLICAKKARPLILNTRFGIHTFGLRFPIDILILDNNHKVAVVKESLPAFRIFMWKPVYNVVIELPAGTIKKTKTSLRDQISIQKF